MSKTICKERVRHNNEKYKSVTNGDFYSGSSTLDILLDISKLHFLTLKMGLIVPLS